MFLVRYKDGDSEEMPIKKVFHILDSQMFDNDDASIESRVEGGVHESDTMEEVEPDTVDKEPDTVEEQDRVMNEVPPQGEARTDNMVGEGRGARKKRRRVLHDC